MGDYFWGSTPEKHAQIDCDMILITILKQLSAISHTQIGLKRVHSDLSLTHAILVFRAPKLSVAEDPVCGSGHCHNIPYWKDVLGKNELVAYQASKRGGTLYCRQEGEKIFMAGEGCAVFHRRIVCLMTESYFILTTAVLSIETPMWLKARRFC